MVEGTRTTAKKAAENAKVDDLPTKEEKTQETANKKATGGAFIYIGPTTNTGLIANSIFTGTREAVEAHLKYTLERIPQVRSLIVRTERLAECKANAKKTGTILNKYYNDVLSLSRQ